MRTALQRILQVLLMNILARAMNISMNTKHACGIHSSRIMNLSMHAQCTCGFSCSELHAKLHSVIVSSFVSTFVSTFVYDVSTFVITLLRKLVCNLLLSSIRILLLSSHLLAK